MRRRILVIAVSDDNYGDTAIRACFNALLKVAMENLRIVDYQIDNIAIDDIDEKRISEQDLVFFAGGGIIKYEYQLFYQHIDRITEIADTFGIPVFFSSVGVESYDDNNEKCIQLKNALRRKCVKGISVRDDLETIRKYISGTSIKVSQVCDPAVWAQHVYNARRDESSQIIGINVVRGGLFKDNGKAWKKQDEMDFLLTIKALLEKNNHDYRFFTNGAFLDEVFLRDFIVSHSIPDKHVLRYINNSQKLVEEIGKFRAVITFRLHASIIAYSMEIPSVALAWNEKVTYFYRLVGLSDRVFAFDDWKGEEVFQRLNTVLNSCERIEHKDDFFMSVYESIYSAINQYCVKDALGKRSIQMYSYPQIVQMLYDKREEMTIYNDSDILAKIESGGRHYLSRIQEIRKRNSQIARYKKETIGYQESKKESEERILNYEKKASSYRKRISNYKKRISSYEERISSYEERISNYEARISDMKSQIDRLNHIFIIRCIHYAERKRGAILRKLKGI